MSKQFLAVGDYLINPELLTYAILEQGATEPRLRIGFATRGTDNDGELQLTGDEAREVLRWLRLNAVFLSTGGAFGSTGNAAQPPQETGSGRFKRNAGRPFAEDWNSSSPTSPFSGPRDEERVSIAGIRP
jgi:hypothetical protein